MPKLRTSVAALLLSTTVACGTAAAAVPIDPSLYSSLHWRLLGPFRAGWAEMVEGVPTRPNTFYFGASGGGVLAGFETFLCSSSILQTLLLLEHLLGAC